MHDIERARTAVSQVTKIEDSLSESGVYYGEAEPRYQRIFNAAVAVYCAMLQAEAIDRGNL